MNKSKLFLGLLFGAVLSLGGLVATDSAQAQDTLTKQERREKRAERAKRDLKEVCAPSSVVPARGLLIKKTGGGHIPNSDARASGFSLICASNCVSTFPAKVYHCDGSDAFKMGYYGRWNGNGKPRAYCAAGGAGACNVSSVANLSKKKKCGLVGYLDLDGNRGKRCMKIFVDGRRNGGV
jgi:hypothetical protein